MLNILNAVLYCYIEIATNSMLENQMESLQRKYLNLSTRVENVQKCQACLPSRNIGWYFVLTYKLKFYKMMFLKHNLVIILGISESKVNETLKRGNLENDENLNIRVANVERDTRTLARKQTDLHSKLDDIRTDVKEIESTIQENITMRMNELEKKTDECKETVEEYTTITDGRLNKLENQTRANKQILTEKFTVNTTRLNGNKNTIQTRNGKYPKGNYMYFIIY